MDNANHIESDEIDTLMAEFIYVCNVPLHACESKYFKNFIGALRPSYGVPTRNRLEEIIGKTHDKIAEAKTIDNLCNELIDRIFDFLDLKSLLNVTGTCKRLQIAAASKFNVDHGKKHVW